MQTHRREAAVSHHIPSSTLLVVACRSVVFVDGCGVIVG
jgi:hypothetical protein